MKIAHDVCAHLTVARETVQIPGRVEPPSSVRSLRGGTLSSVARLPLVVRKQQWVRFADRYYHLRREGLYRFWDWGRTRWADDGRCPQSLGTARRYASVILYRRDILSLLGSLACIHVHGPMHESLPFSRQKAAAKRGLLSLTCGCIAAFSRRILEELGWKTRAVSAMRVRGEYNTYDNGHMLFEFYWPQVRAWVLADIDMAQLFTHAGRFLSLGEVSALIQDGKDFDLFPLTPAGLGRIDSTQAVTGAFPAYENFIPGFATLGGTKEWLRRTLEVPIVWEGGTGYFFCDRPAARRKASRYAEGLTPLKREEWFDRYYGTGAGGGQEHP